MGVMTLTIEGHHSRDHSARIMLFSIDAPLTRQRPDIFSIVSEILRHKCTKKALIVVTA